MESLKSFLDPLLETFGRYIPKAIGALIILFVGWIVAGLVRRLVAMGLGKARLDERLAKSEDSPKVEALCASLVYYGVMLYVFLLALGVLGLEGVLDPLKIMLGSFLGMVPNIIAAALIGFIGYMVAKIVSSVVATVSKSLDKVAGKAGLGEGFCVSKLLGMLVFIVIFVPVLISALDTLKIEAVSVPATEMLGALIGAVPNIIAAAVILGVAFLVGRFVCGIIGSLLESLGADGIPEKIGLGDALSGKLTFSKLCGGLVFFFIMLGASVSALEHLAMPQISQIASEMLVFAGHIVLGLVILAVGNLIANLAYKALSGSDETNAMAAIARIAIMGLVLAMGLRAMGIADDIVNLAFGLVLGAAAVAVALSFGLGGREAAGKQMGYWLGKLRKEP